MSESLLRVCCIHQHREYFVCMEKRRKIVQKKVFSVFFATKSRLQFAIIPPGCYFKSMCLSTLSWRHAKLIYVTKNKKTEARFNSETKRRAHGNGT